MNKVILLGRLAKDPELQYGQSGTAKCTFNLAVNRKYTNQNGEREADFISCIAWQKTAEFVAQYFTKGQQMALEGRLQVRTYEDNTGQRRWVTEVVVEQVEFAGSKQSGQNGQNGRGDDLSYGMGYEVSYDDEIPF